MLFKKFVNKINLSLCYKRDWHTCHYMLYIYISETNTVAIKYRFAYLTGTVAQEGLICCTFTYYVYLTFDMHAYPPWQL